MTDDAQNPTTEPHEDLHHIPAGETVRALKRAEPGNIVILPFPTPVTFFEAESVSPKELVRRGGVDVDKAAAFFRVAGPVEIG